ncbi:MAG: hypothetical protein M3R14_08070 [Acidobacteriota bacterium]|nr:hypothetical protein [Acidobacteriota bacterium]
MDYVCQPKLLKLRFSKIYPKMVSPFVKLRTTVLKVKQSNDEAENSGFGWQQF